VIVAKVSATKAREIAKEISRLVAGKTPAVQQVFDSPQAAHTHR
jgi:hypothetical protein